MSERLRTASLPRELPDAAAVAERHGLRIRGENLAERGSVSVHRVTDAVGRRLVLKHSRGRYGGCESGWLEERRGEPGVATLVGRLEDGFILLEEVSGPLVSQLPQGGAEEARSVGELLRRIERPARAGAAGLERRIAAQERLLPAPPAHLEGAYRLAAEHALRGLGETRQRIGLHGDLHGRNLIRAQHGVVAIDPFGLAGPVAWDMAQFAAISFAGTHLDAPPAASHDRILHELVAGYGERPPLLDTLSDLWLLLVGRMQERARRPGRLWLAPLLERLSPAGGLAAAA